MEIRDSQQKYINDTEWMLTYESTEVIVNSNYMKGEFKDYLDYLLKK